MRDIKLTRGLGVLGVLAVLAATTACAGGAPSGDATGEGDEPLQVFMSAGRTGLFAPQTAAVLRGAEAAIEYINDGGGIDGRLIEIEFGDNQSDPTRGVTLVQDAIADGDPPELVIAGVSSNEALAVAPVLARNEVVGMAPASSADIADPEKYPFFYSQGALQKYLLAGVADFLAEREAKKLAFVGPDDAVGDAIGEALASEIAAAGIEVVEHRFKADAVDVTPAFQAAVADEPDWIFMDAAGTQVGSLLTSRSKAGAEGINTIAGVTAGSQPLLTLAEGTNQMDNVHLIMLPAAFYIDPEDRSDQFNAFFETLTAQGPLELPLSTYAAGWEMINIWADAVSQVDGEVTSHAIRDQMDNLSAEHDRLFYKDTYPEKANVPRPVLGEFIVAKPTGEVRDGMFVIED